MCRAQQLIGLEACVEQSHTQVWTARIQMLCLAHEPHGADCIAFGEQRVYTS